MKTTTITFPDEYKVTVTEERVTVTFNGRTQWDKSIYFRPMPVADTRTAAICAAIRKAGSDPANYLWNQNSLKPVIVRRSNGVEEAIAEATAAQRAENARKDAERKAKWQAEVNRDQVLIAEAKKQAEQFRASVSAGMVVVEVRATGNIDGDEYWAEGVEVKYSDLKFVGCGKAIRPGAQAAFYSEPVYTVSRERLDEIKGVANAKAQEAEAKAKAFEDTRTAKFAEAARTGQPVALESWTETRRAQEGGLWGDYCFVVTEYAMPDGSTKEEAVNTY